MSEIVPAARPRQTREQSEQILSDHGVDLTHAALLGVRGYYRDTMGVPGRNDRGIYDDAILLVTPQYHVAFTANTDPSVTRKGVAVLKTGKWLYRVGIHGLSKPKSQQYSAFVQAGPVVVIRDQTGPDTGWFGINIHRGSHGSTSSLGCQTIHPDQWDSFFALTCAEMQRLQQGVIPYLLIDGPTR